ncbi:MAG: ABC transporter substrate-binding protein [Xanthobacteraceae bacterium]
MPKMISRRGALRNAGALAATASIAKPAILLGQAAMPRVTYVTLATGFNVILNEYMAAKRFDLKHGVNIDVINSYVSVTNYYNDFTAGTFELGIGAWDTWAARFLAGVPLKLVATITDYDMLYVVAMQGGPKSVEDLRGKTLSATLSSGAYRVTKHALSAFHKMEAGKDYKVQNTESPAGAVAMVLGGSAEGGLTWEPNVSVGLEREPKLTTIYNVGEDVQKNAGIALPYFAIALRDEAEKRSPGVAKKVAAAFDECVRGVMANPEEAAKLSADKMKVSQAALLSAFTSKRLVFKPMSMDNPAGREALLKAAEYLAKNGVLEKAVGSDFLA